MTALSGSLSFHTTDQGTTLQAWLPLPPPFSDASDASRPA